MGIGNGREHLSPIAWILVLNYSYISNPQIRANPIMQQQVVQKILGKNYSYNNTNGIFFEYNTTKDCWKE